MLEEYRSKASPKDDLERCTSYIGEVLGGWGGG